MRRNGSSSSRRLFFCSAPVRKFSYLNQVSFLSLSLVCLLLLLAGCGAGIVAPSPDAVLVSPGTLDFGDVVVGQKAYSHITVSNLNPIALDIYKLNLSSPAFSIGSSEKFPLSIAPGSSHIFSIEFLPSAASDYSGQITLIGASKPLGQLSAHGRGRGNQQATAQLSLDTNQLNFGDVAVNSSSTQTVTLTYSGKLPVTVNPATITGTGFAIVGSPLPATLNPGQSIAIQVLFTPKSIGVASGQINIGNESSSDEMVVALNGKGTAVSGSQLSPQLTVSTDSLSFGGVSLDTEATKPILLSSTGTAPVNLHAAIVTGAGFSLAGGALPSTLAPGQSLTLQVRFNPSAAGSANGKLLIESDSSAGDSIVVLSGTTTAPATPQLVLSASSVSFGNVTVNSTTMQSLTLSSVGTDAVTIHSVALTGDGFSISGASFPVTLNPMQSLTLRVQFNPKTIGTANGRLVIASNSAVDGNTEVLLTGAGIAAPSPQLMVSAGRLSFDNVTVNTSTAQSVTLTSTGTAPVIVNSASISGAGFVLTGGSLPVTLAPTQSLTLHVQFNPTKVGASDGKVTIASNSATGSTTEVALSGVSVAAPSPQLTVSTGSLSFGNVTIDTSTVQSLTLTSTGTAPVTVNSAVIAGAGFALADNTLPVTLSPTQSLTLHVQFNPTTVGRANGTLTISSDSSTGSTAEVALGGVSIAAPSPQLTVSVGSLSFGSVAVDTSTAQSLTLTSTGTAPVTVNSATVRGTGFAVVNGSLPVTLAPTQSLTLHVQFNPTTVGRANGTLTINSDSSTGSTTEVALGGVSIAAPSPQLTVSAGSLSFGSVTVDTSTAQSLTLTSTGTAPVTVNSATVRGTGFILVDSSLPVTLAPTQSLTLHLQFNPTTAGRATGALTINSDSSTASTTEIELNGTGLSAPSPQLAVSTGSLSFGNVTVNTSTAQSLTLTSTGTAPVTVNSATVSGTSFAVVGTLPVTLAPTQSITLQVQFSPTSTGRSSEQLLISSNSSAGSPTAVSLSGTGNPAPNPQLTISTASLSFGSVAVNTVVTKTLVLTSTGTSPIVIDSAGTSGTGFTLLAPHFPISLNPAQSMTLQVEFSPMSAGSAAGRVTIHSNSANGSTSIVDLSGTGVAENPQLSVSPGNLNFGSIAVDASATKTLTLTSTGTSPLTVNSAAVSGSGFALIGGSFPITLNPTESLTLQLRFSPTTAGAQSGQITISSNSTSGNPSAVSLSGTGAAAAHEVDLSWDAPVNSPIRVTGYNVYRSVGSSGSLSLINPSLVTTAAYVDSAVATGTTYLYVVRSVDASGQESGPSNQLTITIP